MLMKNWLYVILILGTLLIGLTIGFETKANSHVSSKTKFEKFRTDTKVEDFTLEDYSGVVAYRQHLFLM